MLEMFLSRMRQLFDHCSTTASLPSIPLGKALSSRQWTKNEFFSVEGRFFLEKKDIGIMIFPMPLFLRSSCLVISLLKCLPAFRAFQLRQSLVLVVRNMNLEKNLHLVTMGNNFVHVRVKELSAL